MAVISGDALRNRLERIVCDVLKLPRGSISPEQRFIEDLGADSLMFVEVLANVEDELDIVIAPTEMRKMTTLSGIYRVIARLPQVHQ